MEAVVRYHASFPNVPLVRTVVSADVAASLKPICDVSNCPVAAGEVVWSNREQNLDILESAMPTEDVRYHPKYPNVPLVKRHVASEHTGQWTCDVIDKPAHAGDILWSNRDNDIDVLDVAFSSAHVSTRSSQAGMVQISTDGPSFARAVDALNFMGVELLQALHHESPNIFVSPLSIFIALAMTANGARNDTFAGMIKALCCNGLESMEPINTQMQGLVSALGSQDPKVTFHLANSLWSAVLTKDFITLCKSVFDAEACRTAPSAIAINQWCADRTQNKICQAIDPGLALDPLGAVLVNAVYFKGFWKHEFDKRLTRELPFHGVSGATPCMMMTAKGSGKKNSFRYAESDTHQMVSLPYGDASEYSAVVVLPRSDATPTITMRGGRPGETFAGAACAPRAASLEEVTATIASSWGGFESARSREISGQLQLPRFTVEFGTDLGQVLRARGMEAAFSAGADFSGLSEEALQIDAVFHKTFVEVNEKGTEAAAVTAVVMSRSMSATPQPEPYFTMICNRPFLFFIRHEASNAMLFAGFVREATMQ